MGTTEAVDIVIVGAGQAAAMAAAGLRTQGVAGSILVVGDEALPPYERPPLSKALLQADGADLKCHIHPDGFYEQAGIALRLGVEVVRLDAAAKRARLSDGTEIAYGRCILATGGRARLIDGLSPEHPRVHSLRHMADGLRLRREMAQRRSMLVVGGGFLGLEAASTARSLGLQVTVLENAPALLSRALPPRLSQWLLARARHLGIDVRTGVSGAAFSMRPDGVQARLADGTAIDAELVLVAAGMRPNIDLAAEAGLRLHGVNGGIEVDAQCRTSAPDVFAIGDCASQHHPYVGAHARIESWQNANEQARLVAAALAGTEAAPLAAPWFWSDLCGVNLQIIGAPDASLTYAARGDLSPDAPAPKFLLLGFDADGCIRHAIAVNAGGELRQLRKPIDQRQPLNPQVLCDDSLNFKQAVRAAMPDAATAS